MARPRGTKLNEDRLSDGSTVFSADVTVAVGDRRHVTLGYSREGVDRADALKKLQKEQAKVALREPFIAALAIQAMSPPTPSPLGSPSDPPDAT